jgi:hypothetical protein
LFAIACDEPVVPVTPTPILYSGRIVQVTPNRLLVRYIENTDCSGLIDFGYTGALIRYRAPSSGSLEVGRRVTVELHPSGLIADSCPQQTAASVITLED